MWLFIECTGCLTLMGIQMSHIFLKNNTIQPNSKNSIAGKTPYTSWIFGTLVCTDEEQELRNSC